MKSLSNPPKFYLHLIVAFLSVLNPSNRVVFGSSPKIKWESPWTHQCVLDTIDGPACQRVEYNRSEHGVRVPLETCILTCGDYGGLWPYPSDHIELGKSLTSFALNGLDMTTISAPTEAVRVLVRNALDTAIGTIEKLLLTDRSFDDQGSNKVEVNIQVDNSDDKLKLGLNEAYSLKINTTVSNGGVTTVNVYIIGETFFGVRHGLETFTQLVAFNREVGSLQLIDSVFITDEPAFQYRGLLIDTARNFMPTEYLRKLIDGLSYNKMNILHWHLSDSNSFPFVSKRLPQVTRYGIIDPSKVYTEDDVTSLVEYANARGVKIIPELDAPAHAGNGWQWGSSEGLGELALCVNAQPYKSYCFEPPCGQLNPLNNNTYFVLGELYKDLLDVFDRDIFHMGNDEISYKCWISDAGIQNWLKSHSSDLIHLWGMFQEQALDKLRAASNVIKAIVWTSDMTSFARKYLSPDDYIIQIWSYSNDSVIGDITREKYQLIFSNNETLYLDHGYGAWQGPKDNTTHLRSWQEIYSHDIISIVASHVGQTEAEEALKSGKILGGEATLWSEKVDPHNMETKMWPRGSALAERLWSNPAGNRTRFAYPRLIHHRERMVRRGIQADVLLPESCYHIWGFCDDPDDGFLE